MVGVHFFLEKNGEKNFFPLKIRATRRQWRHIPTVRLSEIHSQNIHDRHTVSRFSLFEVIRQQIQEVSKTQEEHDERVEKRSCEIELRGSHLKLDYYNGKQVLLFIQYVTCY